MKTVDLKEKTRRRDFLGSLATGAATLGLASLASPLSASAENVFMEQGTNPDEWFKKIKGKHKIVYDAPQFHDGFPIIWSWVFYKTNNATGSPDGDLTAMVVLRHSAIPLAMEDRLWEKYKLGENFKIDDGMTKAPAIRNPFYEPKDKMWIDFGIDGIKSLQARGALFCVCDMALTVNSMMMAKGMNMTPEDVKKDWLSGILPGIQVVPSGVWAISRAQEHGCAYCFAG